MSDESFLAGQRKGINALFAVFVGFLTFVWAATLLDYTFNFGWGWDKQMLWLGPAMVFFAAIVRYSAMAIIKFVGSNY